MTRRLITEAEAYELLKKAGVPVLQYSVVRTADEVVRSARSIGYPVVLKVISPDIVQKSDAGGVMTGISGDDSAKSAFDSIMKNAREFKPGAVISGMLVERQQEKGLERLVGGREDPAFGKIITVGMGGTLVELIRDVSLRVLPVNQYDIRAMVRDLKGYRLISWFRNEPPLDEDALVRLIDAVDGLFLAMPELVEFDINPVFLYRNGACAVDARFYLRDAPPEAARRSPGPPLASVYSVKSIAVVGASPEPSKVGYAILRNLLSFEGKVYPVNPKPQMILGWQTFPTPTSILDAIEIAVIVVPARFVAGVVEEAGKKGVPLVIIILSGFREIGKDGAELERRLVSIADQYGIRIMGPNCLGLMMPNQGINTTFDPVSPKPGKIAFISQSGAIITTIVD